LPLEILETRTLSSSVTGGGRFFLPLEILEKIEKIDILKND
jgi:hypothetical protein